MRPGVKGEIPCLSGLQLLESRKGWVYGEEDLTSVPSPPPGPVRLSTFQELPNLFRHPEQPDSQSDVVVIPGKGPVTRSRGHGLCLTPEFV